MEKLALGPNECQSGSPTGCKDDRVDLDAFRWLLTDEGQRLLVAADGRAAPTPWRRRPRCVVRRARSRSRPRSPRSSCGGGPRRSSASWRRGCTSRPRVSSRPPACRSRPTGPPGCGPPTTATLIDLGCGIGGDLVAFARAGITCAGVDLDPVRVAVAVANLEALGLGGAVTVADATTVDTSPFDVAFADPARRVGARAQLRRRRLDPAVVASSQTLLRPRLLREGRPRHPARPRARTASRRSGSATTARSRRRCSGPPAWPPPAAARRSSATAGWPR